MTTVSRQTTANVFDALRPFAAKFTTMESVAAAFKALDAEAFKAEPVSTRTWLKVQAAMTQVLADPQVSSFASMAFRAALEELSTQLFVSQEAA
jgi:hypothetical protein